MANSSMLVLPMKTASAARSRSTAVASYGAMKCSRIFEPQVVRPPRTQRTSLRAKGMPAKGPKSAPAARRWSMSSARARAPSGSTLMKALIWPSIEPMRSSAASTSWRAVISPCCRRALSSWAVAWLSTMG